MLRRSLLCLGCVCSAIAVEERPALVTPIASAYLAFIAKDLPQMPAELANSVDRWFASQPALVDTLIKQNFALADFEKAHEANQAYLKELEKAGSLTVLPTHTNYTFKPTGISAILWISGPESRVTGTIVANGFWPNRAYWQNNPDLNKLLPTVTYQTPSALVMYDLYLKAGARKAWQYLYLPAVYVHRVVNDEAPLNDKNTVIIRQELALATDEQFKKFANNLTQEPVAEVVRAIFECGVWAVQHEFDQSPALVFLSDGKLALVSLMEQPNVTNPLKGFYVHDPVQWKRNLGAGVADLKKWLTKWVTDEKRRDELIKFVDGEAARYNALK